MVVVSTSLEKLHCRTYSLVVQQRPVSLIFIKTAWHETRLKMRVTLAPAHFLLAASPYLQPLPPRAGKTSPKTSTQPP